MLSAMPTKCVIIGLMSTPGVSHNRSLTEQVMDYVRRSTMDGTLATGEWYSVYQLSDQLGISRSPVRDALLRLEEAGLVRFTRNRGFQIVETRPSDVAEIFALRLGIEPAAAYRAATERTEEQLELAEAIVARMSTARDADDEDSFFIHDRALHELIMRMGHSARGADLVERLRSHTRILGPSTAKSMRTLSDIHAEHEPILAAIIRRSPEMARAAMREHLHITGRLLLAQAITRSGGDMEEIWARHTAGV